MPQPCESSRPKDAKSSRPATNPAAAICCGSAGIYNLVQPDAAEALGDRKAQFITPLKADVVASGNPGCVLQLQSSLARLGNKTPVLLTIQLLDASICGNSLSRAYST